MTAAFRPAYAVQDADVGTEADEQLTKALMDRHGIRITDTSGRHTYMRVHSRTVAYAPGKPHHLKAVFFFIEQEPS